MNNKHRGLRGLRFILTFLALEGALAGCVGGSPEIRASATPSSHPATFLAVAAISYGCEKGADQAENTLEDHGIGLPPSKTVYDRQAALNKNCIKAMLGIAVDPRTGNLVGPSDDPNHPSRVTIAGITAGQVGADQGWYPYFMGGPVADFLRQGVADQRNLQATQNATP